MKRLLKITLAHSMPGRIRLKTDFQFTPHERAAIVYGLEKEEYVKSVYVYKYTGSILIHYEIGYEREVLDAIRNFSFQGLSQVEVPQSLISAVESPQIYEIIKGQALKMFIFRFLMPTPIRPFLTVLRSVRFIKEGVKSLLSLRADVALLDATAIVASILDRDFRSAANIMTLLSLGEELEEWTLKKTRRDLEQSLALNIDKVWVVKGEESHLKPLSKVKVGDYVAVSTGNVIPVDGRVYRGDSMVNQSSLTGESASVHKIEGDSVFAGTAIEEGDLIIEVLKDNKETKLYEIINLISESESLKAKSQLKAESMADRLVKFSFLGAITTYALTRNIYKAMAFLMVDYSCALKLTAPIAVMTAMREASKMGVLVKGGKYLELLSKADTIIFDKTGTLTKSTPELVDIVTFKGYDKREALKVAACLEEHFPHSVANAVVAKAVELQVSHREFHTKPEYIVSHGIASSIEGKRVLIGSEHFVVEDEGVEIGEDVEQIIKGFKKDYSLLYLSIDKELVAILLISDPIKPDAKEVIADLRKLGYKKIVMLTGDSENAAAAVAKELGIDDYRSQVLPKDKSDYVESERAKGNITVMIGDGINDVVALSYADVGVAMHMGADIAKEIADITINTNQLKYMVETIKIANGLEIRSKHNYNNIIAVNSVLIALGVAGVLSNTSSSLIHNSATIYGAFRNMRKYL